MAPRDSVPPVAIHTKSRGRNELIGEFKMRAGDVISIMW
jgi:hypothetical protein